MIFTNCGHNQQKFSEVVTLQVRKNPPRYVHLCKACHEKLMKAPWTLFEQKEYA